MRDGRWFALLLSSLILVASLAACRSSPSMCSTRRIGGARFRVCELPPVEAGRLRLFARDSAGAPIATIARLDSLVAARGAQLVFATNGGIFERPDSASGLLVSEGREISPLDTVTPPVDCPDNFRCLPNAVFYLTADGRAGVLAREDFRAARAGLALRFATQSGPMLVRKGALARPFNPASTSVKLRSGVGVRADGTVVFAITDDRVTPHAFAVAFRDDLRTADAMFLDGEISQLFTGGEPAARFTEPFASLIAITAPGPGPSGS